MDAAPRHGSTPTELKRLLELDRGDVPYLVLRDGDGRQVERVLDRPDATVTVGRGGECDLALPWDQAASRLHAELECRAGSWLVVDDGISKNGTFVNTERVTGRRRLIDGDIIAFGATIVTFRDPAAPAAAGTIALGDRIKAEHVSPAQRRVLVALCRPFATGGAHAVPPTNREIAAELFLSDEAVKSHMRALFQRFEIGDLAQNAKRAKLVEVAMRSGVVTPRELAADTP